MKIFKFKISDNKIRIKIHSTNFYFTSILSKNKINLIDYGFYKKDAIIFLKSIKIYYNKKEKNTLNKREFITKINELINTISNDLNRFYVLKDKFTITATPYEEINKSNIDEVNNEV